MGGNDLRGSEPDSADQSLSDQECPADDRAGRFHGSIFYWLIRFFEKNLDLLLKNTT